MMEQNNETDAVTDRKLDFARWFPQYVVRPLTEADLPALVRLGESNPLFYEHSSSENTIGEHQADLTAAPPGIPPERKHFVGFFEGETLIAALDLIDGYPDRETAFLGFFMVAGERSGRGLGSGIIGELCSHMKRAGFRRARLAIDKTNPQSNHFWRKQGFAVLREVDRGRDVVLLAEKEL